MSKQSSKGKLAAALSPIFKHFAGIIKRLQGNSRPLFNDMESLEGRTLLSGGLLQSFQLPNATVSDAVYDSAGNLHVAFRDQTATNLKYAMRSPGGAWSPVMTVDAASGTGGINSIAMNTNGYPAIAYYDGTNNHLKYAKFDGTAWTTETVDTTANDTGKGASLAITSSGAAVISYLDVTTHDLKVARWITDHWGIAAIDTVGDVGREGTVAINPVSGRYA